MPERAQLLPARKNLTCACKICGMLQPSNQGSLHSSPTRHTPQQTAPLSPRAVLQRRRREIRRRPSPKFPRTWYPTAGRAAHRRRSRPRPPKQVKTRNAAHGEDGACIGKHGARGGERGDLQKAGQQLTNCPNKRSSKALGRQSSPFAIKRAPNRETQDSRGQPQHLHQQGGSNGMLACNQRPELEIPGCFGNSQFSYP